MFRTTSQESRNTVSLEETDEVANMADALDGKSSYEEQIAVIGQDLKIAGNLECEGDIEIAGVVDGQVRGRDIVVADDARVNGIIDCEAIQIFGEVEGQVSAARVEVAGTALVIGDISYDALVVQDGATIDGPIKRRNSRAS